MQNEALENVCFLCFKLFGQSLALLWTSWVTALTVFKHSAKAQATRLREHLCRGLQHEANSFPHWFHRAWKISGTTKLVISQLR